MRLWWIGAAAVASLSAVGCSPQWVGFRNGGLRWGAQINDSPLANPSTVSSLAVRWTWPPTNETAKGAFRASPLVYEGRVYVGSSDGHVYAVNATTGEYLWQYPPATQPALTTTYVSNPSSRGVASTAAIATVNGETAVIFGAPDGEGRGQGRLFAVRASNGTQIWRSNVIARLTGNTSCSLTELHEQIGYSSPVVANDRVYIGVADHGDNPIQKGRVVAVRLNDGSIDNGFTYCSAGACPTWNGTSWTGGDNARGGGVWSAPASWIDGVYITTGNSRSDCHGGYSEPSPNHGLSLLRLNPTTGAVMWKFQPVPYHLDGDPDWSAPPTVMLASCGTIVISTMKDGYTHALNQDQTSATAAARWTFPPAATPFTGGDHEDTRYFRGGAVWDDVYVAMNAGLHREAHYDYGYTRLHAFNVCASGSERVRWIVDVPHATGGAYSLGHPVSSRGMFYVTTNEGYVIALADPSIYPSTGWRCTDPDTSTANCAAAGYRLVPVPAVRAQVNVGGRMVYNEPALAEGRMFVATELGRIHMLSP